MAVGGLFGECDGGSFCPPPHLRTTLFTALVLAVPVQCSFFPESLRGTRAPGGNGGALGCPPTFLTEPPPPKNNNSFLHQLWWRAPSKPHGLGIAECEACQRWQASGRQGSSGCTHVSGTTDIPHNPPNYPPFLSHTLPQK